MPVEPEVKGRSNRQEGTLTMTSRCVAPRVARFRGEQHLGARVDQKIRIEQHSFVGTLWFGAWLFTIGLLHLSFWKAVLAILVWPYYVGVALRFLLEH